MQKFFYPKMSEDIYRKCIEYIITGLGGEAFTC